MSNLLNDLVEFFEAQDDETENLALQKLLVEYMICLTDKTESSSLIDAVTSANHYLLDKMNFDDDEECQHKIAKWCNIIRLMNSRLENHANILSPTSS